MTRVYSVVIIFHWIVTIFLYIMTIFHWIPKIFIVIQLFLTLQSHWIPTNYYILNQRMEIRFLKLNFGKQLFPAETQSKDYLFFFNSHILMNFYGFFFRIYWCNRDSIAEEWPYLCAFKGIGNRDTFKFCHTYVECCAERLWNVGVCIQFCLRPLLNLYISNMQRFQRFQKL